MKLVIDTNVLVSSLFWKGAPATLMMAVDGGKASHVLSAPLLEEFIVVVDRPKFTKPLNKMGASVSELVDRVSVGAEKVIPATISQPTKLRDPKDVMVLATALAAEADAIVTGDKDLLVLKEFEGIPILNVCEALARLEVR